MTMTKEKMRPNLILTVSGLTSIMDLPLLSLLDTNPCKEFHLK
jgi:hypothetical protein